jgi:predicted PurR-regulated permease PerM
MRLPRHRRDPGDRGGRGSASTEPAGKLDQDELDELARTFAPPAWLRDLGLASWFLVGFLGLLAGLIWLLGATYTIVGPVVAATIVATVAMPLVGWLQGHRVPRPAGAVVVLLAILALGVIVLVIVIGGITAQTSAISTHANEAADKVESWLKRVGVDQSAPREPNRASKKRYPRSSPR